MSDDSKAIVKYGGRSALSRLRPNQQKALALMMQGMSQKDIADRLGVDRVTVGRWCEREDFRDALAAEMGEVQQLVNGEIRDMQLQAVHTIGALMDDPQSHERTRLDAAKFIIDRAANLPQPEPIEGIPANLVLSAIEDNLATLEATIGNLCEALGIATQSDYLAMSEPEQLLIGCVCEAVATWAESGEIWQPTDADPLVAGLANASRDNPGWLDVAAKRYEWDAELEHLIEELNATEETNTPAQ